MSSQASRTSFSKFTLKPSALSQLTANFNRKLEEIEVPKIEPIDLIGRETNSHSNQENINKDGTKTDGTEGTSSTSGNQAAAPSKEFIFGENITERVVNKPESTSTSATATGEGGESTAEATSEATNGESDDKTGEKQTSSNLPTTSSSNNISSWLNDSENTEKYAAALHESDLYTLCKLNCKLYVLEADKANWLERGYGILKVIETNDGNNCKIMMWTDKCFRVILNTKFFEKMKIDRANNKSLRFNAFDNGTIRIFLIKATNQNDCDELQNVLSSRLELFLSTLQSSKSSASNSQEADADDSTSRTSRKVTKFKCDCTVSRESNPSQSIRAKIHLYMLEAGSSDSVTSPPPPSNSHQLFLEINEAFDSDQKINLNSYLKLVKIKKQKITPGKKGHKYLKFEIVDLAQAKSNIKYNVCINDRASASQFFSLYKKEPKFTSPDDSSSNGTNAFDKDLDDDQQEGVDNEEDEEEDSEESDENEDEDDDGEKSSSSSASSRSRPRSPPSNDDDSLLDRTNNSSITAATNDETSASNVLKRKSDVSDSDVRLAKKPGLDESAVASEDKSEEKSEEKKDEGEEKKEASESVPVVPTAAAASCGGGGTKRNLEESVTSEGGDDSTAADENEGSKKTKVSTEETSQD